MKFLLIGLSVWLVSCATKPTSTKFDGQWEFIDNNQGETKACLSKSDVMKLRETLIRCERGN